MRRELLGAVYLSGKAGACSSGAGTISVHNHSPRAWAKPRRASRRYRRVKKREAFGPAFGGVIDVADAWLQATLLQIKSRLIFPEFASLPEHIG